MKKIIMMMMILLEISTGALRCSDDKYEQYYSSDEAEMKAARQEYDLAREELDRLVERNIDEASVHAILRLLAVELQLVDKLLRSESGAHLDELLTKKRMLLESSTKTASCMYKAVMKFATNDILVTGENGVSKLGSTLRGLDKRSYLRRMKKILAEYRNDFLDKQYEALKRTLGLPVARYAPYAAQEPQAINLDMMQVGAAQSLFNYEPQWCYEDRYGSRALATENVFDSQSSKSEVEQSSADVKFSTLWGDCMAKMRREDAVKLIDDILALVKHEIQTHIGSLSERNKMLYGSSEFENASSFDLVQALAQVPPRVRALFCTLRDAATENTLRIGCWNPDIYERQLDRYAMQLERAKKEPRNVTTIVRQDLVECGESIQCSIKRLTESFAYNVVPLH